MERETNSKTKRAPVARPPRPGARNAFAKWLDSSAGDDLATFARSIAARLDVSLSYVYSLRNGHATPGARLRLRIADLTGGAVPFDSWDSWRRGRRPLAK